MSARKIETYELVRDGVGIGPLYYDRSVEQSESPIPGISWEDWEIIDEAITEGCPGVGIENDDGTWTWYEFELVE